MTPEQRVRGVLAEHLAGRGRKTLDELFAQAIRDAVRVDREVRAAWHEQQAAQIRKMSPLNPGGRWHAETAKAIREHIDE